MNEFDKSQYDDAVKIDAITELNAAIALHDSTAAQQSSKNSKFDSKTPEKGDATNAVHGSDAVPLDTTVTEFIGKVSTKEWISKSFYKQEEDALVLIQGAATSNPDYELPCLVPVEPSQVKATVSSPVTEVGMTSKEFLPARIEQNDDRIRKPGNLQNTEIVQTADKSPAIAQVQQTCAATALVQQPARKNRKGRKHGNDPSANSTTKITSNIQYATGIDLCEENKMAHTVPSQSLNMEQSEEVRSVNNQNTYMEIEQQEQQFACSSRYLSPAHSGVLTLAPVEEYGSKTIPETSPLIPTSQLEVICNEASKMIRDPGKLFSNATKEPESHRKPWHSSQSSFIGQKVPNYKTITLEELEVMSVRDIRRMKEQDQASLSKDMASQQPKRVQPARSSKSNSTWGK